MKTKLDNITRKSRKAILPLILLTTTQLSYAGGSLPVASNRVMITKNLTSKRHKVKLFTASDYKTLLFTVNGVEMKRYALFIFDLEGRLITQSVILNRETGILPELASGAYLYEVMVEDVKVENGQLKIK
jgi:hypothetical protein